MSEEMQKVYNEHLKETEDLNNMDVGTGTINYPVVLYGGEHWYVVNIANVTKKDSSKLISQKLQEVWLEINK